MLLTGVLYNACGPLASVSIVFEATRTTQNGVILGADCAFTTQSDGTYLIDLEPGYYNVYWIERGQRVKLGTVVADEFTESSLPAALQASPMPVDSSALEDFIVESLATMRADLQASQSALQQAQAAQRAAEDARDAAAVAGEVFADTAAGLAATSSGQYFKTPAATGEGFLTLWRNNAGSAVEIETYPSLNGLAAAVLKANQQATRLARSLQRLGDQGQTLHADFAYGAYGLGSAMSGGVDTALAGEELFTVQRSTPKWVFQPSGPNGEIRLTEVPPDTLARGFDPVTGEPLGVIIERVSTNLIPNTLLTDDPAASSGDITVSTGQPDPFGGYTAVRIQRPAAPSYGYVDFYSLGVLSGAHTSQCWARVNDGDGGQTRIKNRTSTSSPRFSGGWGHYSYTETISSAAGYFGILSSDGLAIDVTIAFPQSEPGNTPTSFIPTSGSPVSKSPDKIFKNQISVVSSNGFSLLFTFKYSGGVCTPVNFSTSGTVRMEVDNGNVFADLRGASVGFVDTGISVSEDSLVKACISFSNESCVFFVNGTASYPMSVEDALQVIDRIDVGYRYSSSGFIDSSMSLVEVMPRFLSQAEGEAITS